MYGDRATDEQAFAALLPAGRCDRRNGLRRMRRMRRVRLLRLLAVARLLRVRTRLLLRRRLPVRRLLRRLLPLLRRRIETSEPSKHSLSAQSWQDRL